MTWRGLGLSIWLRDGFLIVKLDVASRYLILIGSAGGTPKRPAPLWNVPTVWQTLCAAPTALYFLNTFSRAYAPGPGSFAPPALSSRTENLLPQRAQRTTEKNQ